MELVLSTPPPTSEGPFGVVNSFTTVDTAKQNTDIAANLMFLGGLWCETPQNTLKHPKPVACLHLVEEQTGTQRTRTIKVSINDSN